MMVPFVVLESLVEPNLSPGGMVPEIFHEFGGFSVGGVELSWNAIATICDPTVPVAGLVVLASSVYTVAPATELTAPSAARDAAAALMTEPMGDSMA